ncbi:hypothetical protein AXF42_Ash021687 [Apostasia shenzhenica]|uniref:DUF659 domain-containing protein n=1 Tax=Apostasia shenzhenica TaxID=1088818 RepID=A0A2H9ZUJ4_9ASPA|nr:hypothetical protein AXF42_Ash021687 [Apostasia shenzhenica]
MAISDGCPMFLKAVNCEGEYKDNFFISQLIKEVISEIGLSNVVQVITDNAPVCKAAACRSDNRRAFSTYFLDIMCCPYIKFGIKEYLLSKKH